ncbi:MAG: hypothetical protein P8Y70_01155 [Candidatus Lokiarchaeota archaeon]
MSDEDLRYKDTTSKKYEERIKQLEDNLRSKDDEINRYLDRIEQLENNVMNLESLLPSNSDDPINKEQIIHSKLGMDLEEKEREIRSLKDKMGFLRKEKLELQKELEKREKANSKNSSVIRVEDIREKVTPLDGLVKELQSKINKQEIVIQDLRKGKSDQEIQQLKEELKEQYELINSLKEENSKLKKELENVGTFSKSSDEKIVSNSLTEELQEKLNRTKRKVDTLEKIIANYEKIYEGTDYKQKIHQLESLIAKKDDRIDKLEKDISELKNQKKSEIPSMVSNDQKEIPNLTEELQVKLNKARVQINNLNKQLQEKESKNPISRDIQNNLQTQIDLPKMSESKLKEYEKKIQEQDTRIKFLKKELEEKENLLKELKSNKEKSPEQKEKIVTKESHVSKGMETRFSELKNLIGELKKTVSEQQTEISELKKE